MTNNSEYYSFGGYQSIPGRVIRAGVDGLLTTVYANIFISNQVNSPNFLITTALAGTAGSIIMRLYSANSSSVATKEESELKKFFYWRGLYGAVISELALNIACTLGKLPENNVHLPEKTPPAIVETWLQRTNKQSPQEVTWQKRTSPVSERNQPTDIVCSKQPLSSTLQQDPFFPKKNRHQLLACDQSDRKRLCGDRSVCSNQDGYEFRVEKDQQSREFS